MPICGLLLFPSQAALGQQFFIGQIVPDILLAPVTNPDPLADQLQPRPGNLAAASGDSLSEQLASSSPDALLDTRPVSLFAVEQRIQQMLPMVSPCVVAVEGGTGVLVSPNGYILTASHVAKQANLPIEVRFPDGRVEMATTLGSNFNTDTAAIRLNSPGPWPFVEFPDSGNCQPGDWCVALGYPLSFPRGKPAAIRMGRILETTPDIIVSDCPIMGGDSGGPLFNLDGQLIGISSRIKNDVEVNLHIPIETFKNQWERTVGFH